MHLSCNFVNVYTKLVNIYGGNNKTQVVLRLFLVMHDNNIMASKDRCMLVMSDREL